MSRLTLQETLETAQLLGEIDELVRKTVAMSDADIDAELRADGIDDAHIARLQKRGLDLLRATRPKALPKVKLFAAGFVAGGATVLIIEAILRAMSPAPPAPLPPPHVRIVTPEQLTAQPPPSAKELRKQAFEACGRGQWQACIARFDEAKDLDPEGDQDPEITAARERAKNALR